MATQNLGPAVLNSRAADYKEFYTNGSKIRISPWDITLIMCHGTSNVDGQAILEEFLGITMSPQHFKILVTSMKGALDAYESNFGSVQLKEEIMKAISGGDAFTSVASGILAKMQGHK